MNFAHFQKTRETLLRDHPGLIDCAATNLYAALARVIPPTSPASEARVHRCHLATQWTELFGFEAEASRRALISCGVRDSLALLFRYYAGIKARLLLPTDNYPVYEELARAAGLEIRKFPTLPLPAWPNATPDTAPEILLVTNPLKPLGRWITREEVTVLSEWLSADPRRRLLLDTVYTFEDRFHPTTLQLLATGQTILLYSLTKGWLHPRLFGVALVPENDFAALSAVFRSEPPPQANLSRARELMHAYSAMPQIIAQALSAARRRMLSFLPSDLSPLSALDAPGYFVPVVGNWESIFAKTKILGVPATAFGSGREDITILTSLSFLQ